MNADAYFRNIMELADSALNPKATHKMTEKEALKRIAQIANQALTHDIESWKKE